MRISPDSHHRKGHKRRYAQVLVFSLALFLSGPVTASYAQAVKAGPEPVKFESKQLSHDDVAGRRFTIARDIPEMVTEAAPCSCPLETVI